MLLQLIADCHLLFRPSLLESSIREQTGEVDLGVSSDRLVLKEAHRCLSWLHGRILFVGCCVDKGWVTTAVIIIIVITTIVAIVVVHILLIVMIVVMMTMRRPTPVLTAMLKYVV